MSALSMNRETALRIALAAKALPGVKVGELLEILNEKITGELCEQSLASISVNDIKTGFSGENGDYLGDFGLDEIKEAVRILWGEKTSCDIPTPTPMLTLPQRSVRIAVCSNSGEKLDGHFGSCTRFLIYQVTATESQLVDVRSTLEADLAEDKNAYRTNLIGDCQVVYVVSIGGPAAAKVIRSDIYPIKRSKGGEAETIIAQLQAVMTTPPPWLAKFIGDAPEERVRFLRAKNEVFSAAS